MRAILFVMLLCSLLFGLEYTQEDRDRLIRVETKLDAMEKRVDQRFEQMDKRFDNIQTQIAQINQYILALLGSIFILVGFVWWDRRTTINQVKLEMKEEIKSEVKQEVDKKVDSYKLQKLDELFSIIEEMAKNDPKIKEIMERHHLKLA